MATPNFVKFSRIGGEVLPVLDRLDAALRQRWQTQLKRVARLRPSNDAYDGGLKLDGEPEACDSPQSALGAMKGAQAFGLIYLATGIPAQLYFYLFDFAAGELSLTLSFDSSIVFFKSDEFERGQWLEGLLTTITCELKPLVCGYGRDAAYMCKHESLNPSLVLKRLRSGELLKLPKPIYHAISTSLIDTNEIVALIDEHKPEPRPRYRLAPGYHVLNNI